MKLFFIGILLLQSHIVLAAKNFQKKGPEKVVNNFKTYECKQKVLPIVVNYEVTKNDIAIDFMFETDMNDFQITKVRGIDGVKLSALNSVPAKDVKRQDNETYRFEYSKTAGLGYAVLEIRANVEGRPRVQMISIPIGELSAKQKKDRAKDIIESDQIQSGSKSKEGSNSKKKIHRMKL